MSSYGFVQRCIFQQITASTHCRHEPQRKTTKTAQNGRPLKNAEEMLESQNESNTPTITLSKYEAGDTKRKPNPPLPHWLFSPSVLSSLSTSYCNASRRDKSKKQNSKIHWFRRVMIETSWIWWIITRFFDFHSNRLKCFIFFSDFNYKFAAFVRNTPRTTTWFRTEKSDILLRMSVFEKGKRW